MPRKRTRRPPKIPDSIRLCPAHTADVRALECAPGFTACQIADARRYYKGFGRPIGHPIPADIQALGCTRQHKLHLARNRLGLCRDCDEVAVDGKKRCLFHLVAAREYFRDKYGCTARKTDAPSYQLELDVVGRLGGE